MVVAGYTAVYTVRVVYTVAVVHIATHTHAAPTWLRSSLGIPTPLQRGTSRHLGGRWAGPVMAATPENKLPWRCTQPLRSTRQE
eukprot:7565203-Pyramimonas_sp.AAC.1